MASGVEQNAPETGYVSRSWLRDLVQAEARFGAHGAVSRHPHFGGGAGERYHEVVAHEVKLMLVPPSFVEVGFHVVAVVHLLPDVLVYLSCNIRFVIYLVMQG